MVCHHSSWFATCIVHTSSCAVLFVTHTYPLSPVYFNLPTPSHVAIDKDDNLMDEWFELIRKRNNLNEKEEELVYTLVPAEASLAGNRVSYIPLISCMFSRKDLELIIQYESLDMELRKRFAKSGMANCPCTTSSQCWFIHLSLCCCR